MHSKARVQAALSRRPTDRVPIFMWFHPATARRLGEWLELPPERVARAMGDDVDQVWVNNNFAMEGVTHEREGDGHTDAWGIEWVREGEFNQIRRSPLANASADAVRAYRFPEDRMVELLAPMERLAASAGPDRFVGCDVSPCVFEMYWRLRGMEQALCDLAEDAELAGGLLDGCADFARRLAEIACDRFHPDWLWTGDDVGGQDAMMLSPDMWRRLVKPRLRRVVAVGKARGLWVAFHSCGAIRPILEDLIEIGVDVLNPVQCNCPGMDPLELKREYGDRLAFMGGVDTQELLPRGSATEVRAATVRLLAGMTVGGGGYLLAASHTIPPETPLENILAMYEVAGVSRAEILDRAASLRAGGSREVG